MKYIGIVVSLVALSFTANICFAQSVQRDAKIVSVQGTVEIKNADGTWVAAQPDMVITQGALIRTKENSRALLNVDGMAQTATVEMVENSQLLMSELLKDETLKTQDTLLDLSLGKILIKAQKLHSENSKFEVKTPTSIVGVRGTSFAVEVEAFE